MLQTDEDYQQIFLKIKWPLIIGLFACILAYYNYLSTIIAFLGYGSCLLLGLIIGVAVAVSTGKKPETSRHEQDDDYVGSTLKTLFELQSESSQSPSMKQPHTVFTKNVDAAVDEVLGLIIRDFILPRLEKLIVDHRDVMDSIREDIWISVQNFKDRLSKIDDVKFLAHDVLKKFCQHYQRIRLASTSNGKDKKVSFALMPYLSSEEAEMEFLRKASEVAIILLAPPTYAQSFPVRHLLREILVCSVLLPAIGMLCDPDYINQKLLSYLQRHQEMLEQHKKTYTYSPSYEGFVKMINECSNIDQLKDIRYNIMTEIMQSTRINNLKKSKGIDVEKEFISQGNAKGDLLQARNLRRYIKQLTVAKSICEKRLRNLGDPDYQLGILASDDYQNVLKNKPLMYAVVMEKEYARKYFMHFLVREDAQYLLEFYIAVAELKDCDKLKLHQFASEIYKVYVPSVSNVLKLDRSILKRMEAFLIANKGPEAFYEAQDEVYKFMEERYYPTFILSDCYHKMMSHADKNGVDFDQPDVGVDEIEICANPVPSVQPEDASTISEYFTAAKLKLEQLEEKLTNKLQALQAMKRTHMADGKVIKRCTAGIWINSPFLKSYFETE